MYSRLQVCVFLKARVLDGGGRFELVCGLWGAENGMGGMERWVSLFIIDNWVYVFPCAFFPNLLKRSLIQSTASA